MKIYKYPLPVDDQVAIVMPQAARILDVQLQHGGAARLGDDRSERQESEAQAAISVKKRLFEVVR